MTREKEIEQAMKDSVAETIYASGWGITSQATDLLECAFTKGAEWADKTMLDNVCRWLDMNLNDYITEGSREGMSKEKREEMFKDLRKDMNL